MPVLRLRLFWRERLGSSSLFDLGLLSLEAVPVEGCGAGEGSVETVAVFSPSPLVLACGAFLSGGWDDGPVNFPIVHLFRRGTECR